MREEQIIFEQVAEILSGQPSYEMAKPGRAPEPSRSARVARGIPFNLDYNVGFAAYGRLGYHLELVESNVGARWVATKDSRICYNKP